MRLSQNFLIDERVAERQIRYADLKSTDRVLEVGPGNGILTRKMAQVARVIAIEIDASLAKKLEGLKNVEVINEDAMKVDFSSLDFNKIVSNIPYHISSPLTFKFLDETFDVAILMYQKEFAERMVASHGSKKYSRLSVMVYQKADCRILENVPRTAFRPVPKVDSCIVEMKPVGKRFDVDDEIFDRVVASLFSHRRKKIKNALMIDGIIDEEMVARLPFMDERVEHLSPEQIAELCRKLEVLNEGV